MEDGDDDLSISASPTPVSASSARRSQRIIWREKQTLLIKTDPKIATPTGIQLQYNSQNQTQLNDDVDLWGEELYKADRLDCLRAQQKPVRARIVPASRNFLSLQCLLESQEITSTDETALETTLLQEKQHPMSIDQIILEDFCSSPNYVEEEPLAYTGSYTAVSWIRCHKGPIRTYSRQRRLRSPPVYDDEDEDRLSCSSGLSMQEDFTAPLPTTTHCSFDPNSSQRICENLQNLSAFFTQNNANTCIDLPTSVVSISETQVEKFERIYPDLPDDASDILNIFGYRLCDDAENDSVNKPQEDAEFTLPGESTSAAEMKELLDNPNSPQNTYFCDDWFDVDFNLQHQPVPKINSPSKENKCGELFEENSLSECAKINSVKHKFNMNHQKMCPISGMKPVDILEHVQFRTASDKAIEVSEEKLKKAAKLMCDIETGYSQSLENIGRSKLTVSKENKLIATENKELEMPDVILIKKETTNECVELDIIPFSEWQPIEISDVVGFRTASNKVIEVSEEKQNQAVNLMADLNTGVLEKPDEHSIGFIKPSDPNTIEFRTASNKTLELTEEMRKKAAMLMADFEFGIPRQSEVGKECPLLNNTVEYRTASNKTVSSTEEMQRAGENLMADFKANIFQKTEVFENDFLDGIPLSEWQPVDISDAVEFPTTSNKPIEVSEEKQKEPIKLMANLEENYSQRLREGSLKLEFRTASNKTVKLTEEMQKKAEMLMADLENVQVNPEGIGLKENSDVNISQTVKTSNAIDVEMEIKKNRNEGIDSLINSTPQPPKLESLSCALETPKGTTEIQISLTQLSERSPLDRATKSCIIARRNLLSLNKRRKMKMDSENCNVNTEDTPIRPSFAPMGTSTSTPLQNNQNNLKTAKDPAKITRSCSQESPSVQRGRLNKRRSEEALSPIYAPTIKTRRLGLSRVRNKSVPDI